MAAVSGWVFNTSRNGEKGRRIRVMSDQIEANYLRDILPSRHMIGNLCLLCFIADLFFSLTNDDYI